MAGHFVRPIEVREDALRGGITRKEEIEAEVRRIMLLPDDMQSAEILKMVDAPLSDRRAFVEAYMSRNRKRN